MDELKRLVSVPYQVAKLYDIQEALAVAQVKNLTEHEDQIVSPTSCGDPRIRDVFVPNSHDAFGLGNLLREFNVRVFLVDGERVRRELYVNFTCGGHGYRYLFILPGELWIDDAMWKASAEFIDYGEETPVPMEFLATVWHEFLEYLAMRRGASYNEAHDMACCFEIMIRNNMFSNELKERLEIAVRVLAIEKAVL